MTRRRRHRDYTPDLIDILDQLIKLYEKRGVDVQATSFRKASHALRDQIVTSAEEVDKLTKIHGVVKATADMFKEFINTGGIREIQEPNCELNCELELAKWPKCELRLRAQK